MTDDVRAKDIKGRHHFRGKALRVAADGSTRVLAEGLRYPTGWATRRTDGAVFFTDNQGQQKTTCEIDRLVPGGWYGYASQADPPSSRARPVVPPCVRIPYPWARSVNGLEFVDAGGRFGPLDGQLILCEYNNRFLLRASLEEVDGQTQGACYPFLENLLGPICLAFAPGGGLYVGSLREPAWGGEPEQGALFRVTYTRTPRLRHPGVEGEARWVSNSRSSPLPPTRRRRPTRAGINSGATTTSSRVRTTRPRPPSKPCESPRPPSKPTARPSA